MAILYLIGILAIYGQVVPAAKYKEPTCVYRLAPNGSYVEESLTEEPDKDVNPEMSWLKFIYYTRSNRDVGFSVSFENTSLVRDFDSSKETIIVIHGWDNDYNSTMPQLVKNAYLSWKDVNVLVIGWGKVSMMNYVTASFNVIPIGQLVGTYIKYMVEHLGLDLNRTGLVGHSLGAHVCGVAGNFVNSSVDHIIGLDPAGPLYILSSNGRLNSSNAKYVQVIHTCAGLLGIPFALGQVDFWPNGGTPIQPGCGPDLFGICSHSRSYEYYAESLSLGGNTFEASQCEFRIFFCFKSKYAIMGDDGISRNATGNYYLTTNSTFPFAED